MKKMRNKELRKLRKRNKAEVDIRMEKYEESIHRQFAAVLMTLRDEFGFGEKRIEKFMSGVIFQISCMNANNVKKNEIFQQIYEETGFCYPEFMNEKLGG